MLPTGLPSSPCSGYNTDTGCPPSSHPTHTQTPCAGLPTHVHILINLLRLWPCHTDALLVHHLRSNTLHYTTLSLTPCVSFWGSDTSWPSPQLSAKMCSSHNCVGILLTLTGPLWITHHRRRLTDPTSNLCILASSSLFMDTPSSPFLVISPSLHRFQHLLSRCSPSTPIFHCLSCSALPNAF